MKSNFSGLRDIRRIIIFLSIIFAVAIIDYRLFLDKSKEIVMYDDFNGHLSAVRVSITKLEYLLDMFVVAGRFETTTVDLIKNDVDKLDAEINAGLLNPKYGTLLRGNALLSDGINSIGDDWQTVKIEIRRLNNAASADEIRLIHDAVDINTVSLIDKGEKLLSVTADARNRVFYSARMQALLSIIGFILISLVATLYVYEKYILPLKRAAARVARAAAGERLIRFDEPAGVVGRLGHQLNRTFMTFESAMADRDRTAQEEAVLVEERTNQIESLGLLLGLASRSISKNEIFNSVVREAAACGGADGAAIYFIASGGFRFKAAAGFPATESGVATISYPDCDLSPHSRMRLYERVEEFPDAAYGAYLSRLGFSALAAFPIRFNDKAVGALLAAYKDAGRATAAPVQFFESLAAAVGAYSGHIELFQTEMTARRFLERVVNQLPYGVAVFDRDGACRLFNNPFRILMGADAQCEYTLFDDKALIESGATGLFKKSFEGYPADVTVDYDPSALLVKHGFTGGPKKLRIKGCPIYGTDGEISHIVLIYEELSKDSEAAARGAS